MDRRRELIIRNTLEVLQSVLPTNIMENLKRLDADDNEHCDGTPNDLDEDRFFYNYLSAQTPNITPKLEPMENNDSLTYFEIVEQEMMLSLPVTKYNIEVWSFNYMKLAVCMSQ